MIIKIAAMAMIMLSSVMLGLGFAECLASRERELSNLADAVEFMIGELGYTRLCIRDIIFRVSPYVKGETADFFDSMCTSLSRGDSVSLAWTDSLCQKAAAMSLKKEDVCLLEKSAHLLEAYEFDEQISCLNSLRERILKITEEAAEAKRKNSRIAKMLGIYGGILICIITF